MKALSYGPRNVQTNAGGSLGVGVMARGSQCLGFAEDRDVLGVRFDPMLKSFTWITVANWSEAPDGPATLEEFRQSFDALVERLNNPVRAKNIDFPGR